MTNLELLAPAKNLECGKSAIDHGADAVYIGAERFGARASAGNSIDDIAALCEYAHQFGARVFVTVNTIIYDDEMQDTIALCQKLNAIGVDALLVQDFGLVELLKNQKNPEQSEHIKKTLPREGLGGAPDGLGGAALHASTQTDNRTIEKVKWLSSMGFKRVVLARELSIEEIAEIHKAVPEVELEVFVHGALCVSYSGQCYASQHCFKRSANRGECAQFCRMAFTLKDADGKILEDEAHLLSLRDMAQLDNLERLVEAGAVSFKIEGRLKDADYVKNITAAYSERLNAICHKHPDKYRRSSMGRCTYTFTPDIRKSFNRGFTTYFADGVKKAREHSMVSFDTPKAIGEPVGKVKEIRGNSFNVASMAAFSNGDGLCFFDDNRKLIGFRVNRCEGNRLFPLQMPRELKRGTMLYRNHDQAFQTLLSKPSSERKVSVSMLISITQDTLTLTLTDEQGNIRKASVSYDYQPAQKPQDENIQRQLTKLGGTIYTCSNLQIDSKVQSPFIPSSTLSSLRRMALEAELTTCSSEANSKPSGGNNSLIDKQSPSESAVPQYPLPYLYNASNKESQAFYKARGIEAEAFESNNANNLEASNGKKLLMQCRYCLKAEMGYCTKSGRRAPWREPLTITLADGKTFALNFNCRKCEMEVTTC